MVTFIVDQKDDKLNLYVGRTIQKRRGSLYMSQHQLAQYVKTTEKNIISYESGQKSVPVHTLFLISYVLNVPVTELLPDIDIYLTDKITLDW